MKLEGGGTVGSTAGAFAKGFAVCRHQQAPDKNSGPNLGGIVDIQAGRSDYHQST